MSSQLKGNSRAQCLAILGQWISLVYLYLYSWLCCLCWSWSGVSLTRMPVPVSWHNFLFSLSFVMHPCSMLAIEMQQQQLRQPPSKVLPNCSRKIWFNFFRFGFFLCALSFVSPFSFAYFALSTRFQQCANILYVRICNCLCCFLRVMPNT